MLQADGCWSLKNTLINVVLKDDGIDALTETLNGPTALVLVGEDPVAPAKALVDYAKDHAKDLPIPKGGMLQGNPVSGTQLNNIAKLPSREQLQAEFVGVLQAPLTQLVACSKVHRATWYLYLTTTLIN